MLQEEEGEALRLQVPSLLEALLISLISFVLMVLRYYVKENGPEIISMYL